MIQFVGISALHRSYRQIRNFLERSKSVSVRRWKLIVIPDHFYVKRRNGNFGKMNEVDLMSNARIPAVTDAALVRGEVTSNYHETTHRIIVLRNFDRLTETCTSRSQADDGSLILFSLVCLSGVFPWTLPEYSRVVADRLYRSVVMLKKDGMCVKNDS